MLIAHQLERNKRTNYHGLNKETFFYAWFTRAENYMISHPVVLQLFFISLQFECTYMVSKEITPSSPLANMLLALLVESIGTVNIVLFFTRKHCFTLHNQLVYKLTTYNLNLYGAYYVPKKVSVFLKVPVVKVKRYNV